MYPWAGDAVTVTDCPTLYLFSPSDVSAVPIPLPFSSIIPYFFLSIFTVLVFALYTVYPSIFFASYVFPSNPSICVVLQLNVESYSCATLYTCTPAS